jgi:hypothetical protein
MLKLNYPKALPRRKAERLELMKKLRKEIISSTIRVLLAEKASIK